MNIVGFDFKGSAVRTITIGKEAWYIAKDVCDILGYNKVESALRKLDEDEKGAQILSISSIPDAQNLSIR